MLIAALMVLQASGFKLLGVNSHPFAFVIWIQVFVLTLVGLVAIAVFDAPMSYNTSGVISNETRTHVLRLVLFSLVILFLGLAILFKLKILGPFKYGIRPGDRELVGLFTYVSLCALIIKISVTDQIPFILILQGDYLGAMQAKINILTKKTGITFFGINYIFRGVTSYVYIASLLIYLNSPSKKNRILYFANLTLAVIDSLYDTQKQGLVLLVLATFWIIYVQEGKFRRLVKGGSIAVFVSVLMFAVTLGFESGQDFAKEALNRIFISQAEGLFFILELLDPSEKYLWLGVPFASILKLDQVDPSAEVIQILFPGMGDAWINSNAFYIAHAWTIFGDWAIIIGPVFVLINILIILRIGRQMVGRSIIFYAIIFWCIIKMPLANNFTEFLWMKVVLDVLINVAFASFMISIFKRRVWVS